MVNVPWCHDCDEPLGLCKCCKECGWPPKGFDKRFYEKDRPQCKKCKKERQVVKKETLKVVVRKTIGPHGKANGSVYYPSREFGFTNSQTDGFLLQDLNHEIRDW